MNKGYCWRGCKEINTITQTLSQLSSSKNVSSGNNRQREEEVNVMLVTEVLPPKIGNYLNDYILLCSVVDNSVNKSII